MGSYLGSLVLAWHPGKLVVMEFNLGLPGMLKVSGQAECEILPGFPGDRVVIGKAVGVVGWNMEPCSWGAV